MCVCRNQIHVLCLHTWRGFVDLSVTERCQRLTPSEMKYFVGDVGFGSRLSLLSHLSNSCSSCATSETNLRPSGDYDALSAANNREFRVCATSFVWYSFPDCLRRRKVSDYSQHKHHSFHNWTIPFSLSLDDDTDAIVSPRQDFTSRILLQ